MNFKCFLLIITASLFYTELNAQNYKDNFRNDICNCFEEAQPETYALDRTVGKCFREQLPKYAALIDREIKDSVVMIKLRKGQLARQNLFYSYKYELIYTCERYRSLADSARAEQLSTFKKTYGNEEYLIRANQQVAMNPNWFSYHGRSQIHFGLGNLNKAEQDLRYAMSIMNYEDPQYKLLLAWILEEKKEYGKAVQIYDELITGLANMTLTRLRAMANKKAGGRMELPKGQGPTRSDPTRIIGNQGSKVENNSRRSRRSRSTDSLKANKKKKDKVLDLFKIDHN
jgi:hypothetical protein